jgi:cytoskeletal protein CcmA (bactofilin family)
MNGAGAILLVVFAGMLVLPFVPGLFEIRRPRDRYPLLVNLDYAKDPRYLGRRLRGLLRAGLEDAATDAPGTHDVQLSKPERVEVSAARTLEPDSTCDVVLYVRGDLDAGRGSRLREDAYVLGSAVLQADCDVRTLACDGEVRLGAGARVRRWLDADHDVWVAERCDLGAYCATAGVLHLADGVRFTRLFAGPILTQGAVPRPLPTLPAVLPPLPRPERPHDELTASIDEALAWHAGDLTLAVDSRQGGDAVVRGNLRLERGAVLRGRVRVYGDCHLQEGSVLDGDLYADGDVVLGDGVTVTGIIFTQARVTIGRGSQIGRPGAVKSVVGNRGVTLGREVVVHGQVHAECEGRVSCRDHS